MRQIPCWRFGLVKIPGIKRTRPDQRQGSVVGPCTVAWRANGSPEIIHHRVGDASQEPFWAVLLLGSTTSGEPMIHLHTTALKPNQQSERRLGIFDSRSRLKAVDGGCRDVVGLVTLLVALRERLTGILRSRNRLTGLRHHARSRSQRRRSGVDRGSVIRRSATATVGAGVATASGFTALVAREHAAEAVQEGRLAARIRTSVAARSGVNVRRGAGVAGRLATVIAMEPTEEALQERFLAARIAASVAARAAVGVGRATATASTRSRSRNDYRGRRGGDGITRREPSRCHQQES